MSDLICARSPVVAVPVEILQEIFLHHRDLVHGQPDMKSASRQNKSIVRRSPGYQWIAVSHVCRRWRAAAVYCSPLWTHVVVTHSAEWMSQVIVRSNSMPLRVTADLGATMGDKTRAFQRVLAELHRIRTLYLSGRVDDDIIPLFENAAPRLERLVLDHVVLPTPVDPKHCDDVHTYFPSFLHRERTPRLRYLELDAFRPQLRGPCADSLRHLVFRHRVAGTLMGKRYTGPCLRTLLDALQNMPSLESLAFEKEAHATLDPAAEAELQSSLPDAALPCLRTLRIHATAEESVALLDRLSLPALTSLTLSCARNSTEYPLTLPTVLAGTLSAVPETHALHLARFTGSGFHRYMRFTGYAASAPTFDVMVDRGYGRDEIVPIVSGGLPLQAVRELVIDSQEEMSEGTWRNVLDALPNVSSIAVTGQFAQQRLYDVRTCLKYILGVGEQGDESDLSTGRRVPVLRAVN
ncbi:hypothetical protein DAEQUDRAFT_815531 [Daedalea quercina L-15889]|uniref:Uncharacterized protein n=1 Tax=Daedalea quercina L-15889 TaxID=1314783 RepID=A0A165KVI7_9APHY|nr:hypothetical protein DAEQUDRAFT_815531 [Daedalea quercina L-15889]